MIRVISAELRKLRRPTLLISTMLVVTLLTSLFTFLVFWNIGNPEGNGRRGEQISAAVLSTPEGLVYGFRLVSFLLGIVALCIFASQMGQEYTHGTLRNLLVRQPSRMKILGGKYISMILFAIVMIIFSLSSSVAIAYALSGHAHVTTTAWTSHAGLQLLGESIGNVFISVLGFGTVGMILGILFRSPISSIAVGVIWFLILDNILAGVVSSTARWLPGQNLTNITSGGNFTVSYGHSLLMSAIYIGTSTVVVSILFKRRDVAN